MRSCCRYRLAGKPGCAPVGLPAKRHRPERALLYQLVEQYYPALKANLASEGTFLPGYVERAGRPRRPGDLATHNCIVLGENRNWKLRDRAGGVREVRVTGNFSTNYGEVITEAALAGAGIALKSLWDIRHLLAEGSLLSVLEDYTVEPVWSLWAVRPPGEMVPARVRAFIHFMETKFREVES